MHSIEQWKKDLLQLHLVVNPGRENSKLMLFFFFCLFVCTLIHLSWPCTTVQVGVSMCHRAMLKNLL